MLRIALTGGVASGKSTVARLFEALGAKLIDTDQVARDIVAPGTPALAQIAGQFGPTAAGAGALLLGFFLVALTFIDLDTQLLPDDMTLPLLWIGLLLPILLPAGERLPVDLRTAVIGAVAGYLSLWGVYHLFKLLTGKEGMGYGDFKLLAALGAWLGWKMLLPIIIGAAGVGALVGITSIVLGRRGKGVPMAFGPYLAAAGWIMLMWGPALVDRYLGLYGPR